MPTVVNLRSGNVWVKLASGEMHTLEPGKTADVDQRWLTGNPMVKAQWLRVENDAPQAAPEVKRSSGPAEPVPASEPEAVYAEKYQDETGNWRAIVDGLDFDIRENQVRDDGTLTSGGIKALEAARKGE